MERFFIFDNYNTWYDWNLILTAKDITPPEPKTNLVELDGMSGSLDLSEALTGEITYKDRTVSATFWTDYGSFKDRSLMLNEIVKCLHGKKVKIIEPDDPTHYFYGRVVVKSINNIMPYATFTIEAQCEPWKYAVEQTTRFIRVNNNDVDVIVNNNGVKTLLPVVKINGSINLNYNNSITTLTTGSYKITDLKFRQGTNVIGISGKGSVSFIYREADL